jgi:hypothetical protein
MSTGLQTNPLGQEIGGMLLRCGGVVKRGMFGRAVCGTPFLLTAPFAGWPALLDVLKPHGWSLGLASLGGQGSALVDGRLYVAGTPVYDPLCPKCTKNLLSRLSAEGS